MVDTLGSAPVLSTPDNHILTEVDIVENFESSSTLSEEQLRIRYEISRTIREIRQHRWRRVALQFPDHMLSYSSRVYEALSKGLSRPDKSVEENQNTNEKSIVTQTETLNLAEEEKSVKLTILADTSYGSCCVDEIAAEHVDADAVVHYGRSCLSPTARLPVLHIFTLRELNHSKVINAFIQTFPDTTTPVILTGDIPYANHVESIGHALREAGYDRVFNAQITHNPASLVPNRTLPTGVETASQLSEWHLFHIAEPPTSLLLTLSSRMKSIQIYSPETDDRQQKTPAAHEINTATVLRRRYALVTSMTTVSTWGILINTLSVKNYLSVVDLVKKQIADAGKKSYLFVVGKLNAAKVANFAEIGGWVVIGCWESSLIDSREFFKPILTPFELDMALARDDSRVWTGTWQSDFDSILSQANEKALDGKAGHEVDDLGPSDLDSEEESAPPEFDLRTGRYVAQTRPMNAQNMSGGEPASSSVEGSKALTKRMNGDLVAVNGVVSPAANYLHEMRTWKGLGSDFESRYEDDEQQGGLIEEGRAGIARGYHLGDSTRT